jgi:hypothetical protein
VARHGDADFHFDLVAQLSQCPACRGQRTQLIDDHVAIAVHGVSAVTVVFAAMDRYPDRIAGTKKVIVLRRAESWSQRDAGSGKYVVAEEPHGLAGAAAEGNLQFAVLIGSLDHGTPDPRLLVGTSTSCGAIKP